MESKNRLKIGLAGELRVMSELLLRGHNPAKSYLNDGVDIWLESGIKIEVKAAHRLRHSGGRSYLFALKGGGRKQVQNLSQCDFIILWCMDEDCFFIIPKGEVTATAISIGTITPKCKYYPFLGKWDLLRS